MNVYVATRSRIKLRAVRDVFAEWRRDAEVNVGAVDPPVGLPEQPLGDGRVFLGLGPGYELPEGLRAMVLAGTPLRRALRLRLSVDDTEDRGAIHYLSDGRLDRYRITLDAVRMALVSHSSRTT